MFTARTASFLYPEHLAPADAFCARYSRRGLLMCTQPTYFGGPFALAWGANDPKTRSGASTAAIAARYAANGIKTGYYNPDVHTASFVLPNYIADAWAGAVG